MSEHQDAILLRRAKTDLRELLASSMEEIMKRQAAERDINLRFEAADDIPHEAWLDPEKIAWVVVTLVGNALRHARPGTRLMPGGSILVKVEFARQENEWVIVVSDDGPGIPKEKVPYLFQRAEGATHAAGLGLMLIHDVVTAHGGRIEVESKRGGFDHGTSIRLRVPAR